MAEPILKIKDLVVEFPSRKGIFTAVNGIELEIQKGEVLGIVGESGAGKSMTGLATVGLLEPPGRITRGNIHLDGKRIDNLSQEALQSIRGKRISMIFQDPLTSLNPLYSISRQLVETIQKHLPVTAKEARRRAISLLEEVGIPEPEYRVDHYPHQFSGGMRQRVVIALALCAEPDLIIADEPTTALDVSVQAQIIKVLKQLCREKQTAIMLITHDMGVIAETADRVAVMYAGEIVETGTMHEILKTPKHPYTKALIGCIPKLNEPKERLTQIKWENKGSKKATNSAILVEHKPKSKKKISKKNKATTAAILRVENLVRKFDISKPWLNRLLEGEEKRFLTAVNNVSFEINRGETYALVGESGSGKSTIGKLIVGLLKASSGDVYFNGQKMDTTAGNTLRELRSSLQMIFQDPFASLNPRWHVRDIIAEPIRMFGMKGEPGTIENRVNSLLETVGLTAFDGAKYPHEFSGGQRQRIAIARALSSKPEFIVCDEPTSALDVSVQAQILNLMKDLQDKFGLTYLFISHDLSVVRHMATRIGVLYQGELVEINDGNSLFKNPQHAYTKMLLDAVPDIELSTKVHK